MKFPWIPVVVLAALLGGCAANPAKRDAYADAAELKRAEIGRISAQIAQLRARPDAAFISRKIDSLETLRSVAKAGLGGIGQAVEEKKRMDAEVHMVNIQAIDSAAIRKNQIMNR